MNFTKMLQRIYRGTLTVIVAVLLFAAHGHADAPAGRYTVSAGSVTDNLTGLVWQQVVASSSYNYADAKQYCAGLTGGTWRLPSPKELQTLVDESRKNPAIDTTAFPNTPSTNVRTSVSNWVVSFGDGIAGTADATTPYSVRCVR